ncbi:lysozyme [Qipengyuania sp. SS22]|uniref:lysozyme n=1 Tax=Qipengyuania sp. SS22 TaxID=2979461 RepID=UPI0021E59E18|nr:lysozyme [Qipengyuania sp. SS22]UYH56128.1 lysozyme [Qipengyuania sp. SS22]
MDKDTAHNRNQAGGTRHASAPSANTDDTLKTILDDLNRPLDEVDWSHTTLHGKRGEKPERFLKRLRRERQHRRELRRARQAAAKAFDVRPRLSTRKHATLMLGAGALGLTAFTGPPRAPQPSAANMVLGPTQGVRQPAPLLTASDTFKQALIEEEGVRYTVYRDVAGYPTVGVGHLVQPRDRLRVGDRVSEQRVLAFLDADLAEAEQGVRQLVGDLPLHQHEFDALLDLVYNVGIGNVSPSESPRLNAAIDARDYDAIAEELNYTHAGGAFAKGLEHRSDRRASIFMDAAYENPRESAAHNAA